MEKSLSKRAVEGRRWRTLARHKRRLNTVISKYVEQKYQHIYTRCTEFYDSTVHKYPAVQDLTKTQEFREWIEATVGTRHETQPGLKGQVGNNKEYEKPSTGNSKTANSEEYGKSSTDNDQTANSEEYEKPSTDNDQIGNSKEYEKSSADNGQTANSEEYEKPSTDNDQIGNSNDEIISVTPGNTYVEPGVIINEYIVNNNTISEAMSGATEDTDEGFDRCADMDTIIGNIIRDLEAAEPDIFRDLDDQGLGLNAEDEIGSLMNEYDNDNIWW